MQHNDFTGQNHIVARVIDADCGMLVGICQLSGSVSFTFPMLPSVARELAADLVKQADEAEGV